MTSRSFREISLTGRSDRRGPSYRFIWRSARERLQAAGRRVGKVATTLRAHAGHVVVARRRVPAPEPPPHAGVAVVLDHGGDVDPVFTLPWRNDAGRGCED